MNKALQRFFTWVTLVCLLFVFAACGGGDGGSDPGVAESMTTISGTATKGPIRGGLVQIFQLLPDGRSGKLLGSGITGENGAYTIVIPESAANSPVVIKVSGQKGATYKSETTALDVPFKTGESFNAVVETVVPGQVIAVTPITEAAYQQFQKILTDTPSLANKTKVGAAINAANDRIATLYFGQGSTGSVILADPKNNKSYAAALKIIDQIIVSQGIQADTTSVMNIINQALSDAVVTNPVYQSYLKTLTAAAEKVTANPLNAADTTLASVIDALVLQAVAPPVAPDYTDIVQPSAPSNLTATTSLGTTTGSVFLSWHAATDNIAVAGYDIYRDGIKISTVKSGVLAYTDAARAINATYRYVVFAFDAVGNRSVASNQVLVPLGIPIADTEVPSTPTGLKASTFITNSTTASVVLMWTPSTDNKAVTGYNVYRDGILIAAVTLPGFTDSAVVLTTAYNYNVVARDGAGNLSPASKTLHVTPNLPSLLVTVNGQLSSSILGLPHLDLVAPTAPAKLSAATFSQTSTRSTVVLSWSASTDDSAVAGYEIYRNGIKIATVATPGYSDPSLISNVTYTYFVMAFDTSGNRSIASNQLDVRPNTASLDVTVSGQISSGVIGMPSVPTTPANLTASTAAVSATSSTVMLAWSPSSSAVSITGYEVYRNGSKVAVVSVPAYADPSVASNVTYTYYIIAVDASGYRSYASNELLVTPNQASLGVTINVQLSSGIIGLPSVPTTPSNLTASTAAISATTSSVFLSWSPSSSSSSLITGYDVYRNGSRIATVILPGYTDSSAIPNTAYSYYVVAFDAAGNRSFASYQLVVTPNQASLGVTISAQISAGVIGLPHLDLVAPTAPANLAAATFSQTSTKSTVVLSWSASTDDSAVTGYDVYRNGAKIATVATPGYSDPSLNSNVTYTYSVMAFDSSGNRSIASNQVSVTPAAAILGVTISGQLSSAILGF